MVPLSTPLIKYYLNQAAKTPCNYFLIPRKSHPSKEPPIKISLKGKGQKIYIMKTDAIWEEEGTMQRRICQCASDSMQM